MRANIDHFVLTLILMDRALSVALTQSLAQKGTVPTTLGQIGVNPVTILGPAEQYIAPVASDNPVLVVENGQTKWKGANSLYFTTAPITQTIDDQVETAVIPVQISASKATASADGVDVDDVIITIVPNLKSELEEFAADAVEICKLDIKLKRDNGPVIAAATDAFSDCIFRESVKATSSGGRLEGALQGFDLEAGRLALPEPPAGPSLEIDAWAAVLQIAKNQVRKKEAWLIAIVLTTYFSTAAVYHSYRVPSSPKDVINSIITPSATQQCNPGAPTGADAPVCGDDNCQGLPRDKKCVLGDWKGCDCLGAVVFGGDFGLINPAWLVQQAQILAEVDAAPESGVECSLQDSKGFDGTPIYDPPEWCLCGNLFEPHTSSYSILPSPTKPCDYTSLPPSQITVKSSTINSKPPLTTCRSFITTAHDTAYTSCTCNGNRPYPWPTVTDIGCDWYVQQAATGASQTPAPTSTPTASLPPAQSVNGGQLYCPSEHKNGNDNKLEWYMSLQAAQQAIDQFCGTWDIGNKPVGPPGNNDKNVKVQSAYSERVYVSVNAQDANGEKATVYFIVTYIGGSNCPILDIGGKDSDKKGLCLNLYGTTIIDGCDPNQNGQQYWKQGGRFVRDCLQFQVAKCDVAKNPDCLFS